MFEPNEFLLVDPSGSPRKAILLVEPNERKVDAKSQQNYDPKYTPEQASNMQTQVAARINTTGQPTQQISIQAPANMTSIKLEVPSANPNVQEANDLVVTQAQVAAQREALQEISQIASTQPPNQILFNASQPSAPDISAQIPTSGLKEVVNPTSEVVQARIFPACSDASDGRSVPFNVTRGDAEPGGIVLKEYGPSRMDTD
ncbi:12035_t:CDS:1 [Funneliformis geosporum]|uniref:8256_t:CDS:1 n=1 Tax=Funneliformis geosporum TaxID=1117311 RepID=A0A9W4T0W6_9GLOM|nr:12035_t:CDS:1 [Funneliformis geosporum]CAI2187706.1 8256_t:CDS:1 [Funneliformis geosporum]